VDPPGAGTVTVLTDGNVDYTHDGSEGTADTFTYTIEDSTGVPSDVANVLINVNRQIAAGLLAAPEQAAGQPAEGGSAEGQGGGTPPQPGSAGDLSV